MGQVMESVTEAQKRISREAERLHHAEKQSQVQQIEEAQYEAEIQTIEAQFCEAYPDPQKQDQVLEQFAAQLPFFKPGSAGYRSLAIRHWWSGTHREQNDKSVIFQ